MEHIDQMSPPARAAWIETVVAKKAGRPRGSRNKKPAEAIATSEQEVLT